MSSLQLRAWAILSLVTSAALAVAGFGLRSDRRIPFYERPAIDIVLGLAAAMAVIVLVVLAARRFGLFPGEERTPTREPLHRRHPYWTLLIISFVALFVELMLIRYCSSQIRVFSFYKNVPLIACFLGLGLGCSLARGGSRHALSFLLWLVPFAVFLSGGSLAVANWLGKHAAIGTSELILGDFIPTDEDTTRKLPSQLLVAGFCVATFVVVTLLFGLLGRMMGQAFEQVRRLRGYTVNIVGSLAGILAFILLSYLQSPPWVWFAAGLAPLLWWLQARRSAFAAIALILVNVAVVAPSYGDTVWSPYQKLVGHPVPLLGGNLQARGYLVEISDVFYQLAVDRRPETLAATGTNPMGHYDAIYAAIPTPQRVLIVGAGTGNDVAAALRAGVGRVDAVEIDPAIVEVGRRHHVERPYDDPRVRVIVDDARHAFQLQPAESYDAVVFGLLDSHTQLGISSVRLDNYVFTTESLAAAKRLVRPGGHIVITAATFTDWFQERLTAMLRSTVDETVQVYPYRRWVTYIAPVGRSGPSPGGTSALLPTDDWPFLYLPAKGIPRAYVAVLACLVIASVLVSRLSGLRFGSFGSYHGHLFFLGAAFLLMEVHAINRLALLFGTTWLVSAVTIAIVLLLIVGANFTVIGFGRVPYVVSFGALAVTLGISFWIQPAAILGKGTLAALAFGVVLLSPVFFAGLVFARSFRGAELAAPAMGANILGSVVGGWAEYGTMALGIRALVLLAAAFYAASLLLLVWGVRRGSIRLS